MFLITDAMAATAAAQPSLTESLSSMLPMFLVVFGLFYFMLIRPQNKKQKEHQALIEALKVGDEILTTGGMLAKIVKIKDDYIVVEPNESSTLVLQRAAIGSVMPKGTLKSMA